jgi:hypothetical protein
VKGSTRAFGFAAPLMAASVVLRGGNQQLETTRPVRQVIKKTPPIKADPNPNPTISQAIQEEEAKAKLDAPVVAY